MSDDVQELVRNQVELNLRYRIDGVGVLAMPGAEVPPLMHGDMLQSARMDYEMAVAEHNAIAAVWIRRADHAEKYAVAMEKELESMRKRVAKMQDAEDLRTRAATYEAD